MDARGALAARRARPERSRRAHLCRETIVLPSGAVIRPELVAHAKALLEAGLVGANMRRLAECLIDIGIHEGDWLWPSDR
jgi:hypothetical protein